MNWYAVRRVDYVTKKNIFFFIFVVANAPRFDDIIKNVAFCRKSNNN